MYKEYAEKVLYEIGRRYAEEPEQKKELNKAAWRDTGLRFVPIIEEKIGRKITEKEWYDLSVR